MRGSRRSAIRIAPVGRLALSILAAVACIPHAAHSQAVATRLPEVRVVTDSAGSRLQVDGRDFFVKGMNWDYFPVGQTVFYSLWTQPDDLIRSALDREMSLLRSMGVNVIRQYNGVPPRWVRYIYENYGIWTILNHPLGRYGTTVNGVYVAQTDYSDRRVRESLVREFTALVDEFRETPGVLMWLIGNENNYGLQWRSAATENLPEGERQAAKARYLYSLVGETAQAIKARDRSRPVAMANGDLQYLDIIAQEAKAIDVFGTNVYRGRSFGTLFQEVKDRLGVPVMFTEFGADAWNTREMREDQLMQARYVLAQWQEIYEQSAGKGRVGNAIGGLTFQWSDGWWKDGQDVRLDQHDVTASWANAAYVEDFVQGENNMNEEWWGIVAKGPTDARGQFELFPRAAYFALQRAFTLDPYAPETDLATIRAHFAAIDPTQMVLAARASGGPAGDAASPVRVSGMRIELETFSTGGTRVTTPPASAPNPTLRPAFRGFDRLESFYVDLTAQPAPTFTALLSLNVLGNVPDNPIDEIFYENRGRARTVIADGQPLRLTSNDRLAVYRASVSWDARSFNAQAFYRTGHYHWGYEGDFFGLYREANYGRSIDVYNAYAPIGIELTGKRQFEGLKLAFGPELWWGANPAAIAKYRRRIGTFDVTGMFQEDLARVAANEATSSFAIPQPQTRKATLSAATTVLGRLGVEVGGIWSGQPRVGDRFQIYEKGRVLRDSVRASDTFGAKARTTLTVGRYSWYAQGAAMGLVAEAGPTAIQTYTGWWLRDAGTGNQWNVMTGVSAIFGAFQIAPNVLYQKPIVGPIPFDAPVPARPRNILDDPFVVRANREMAAGELVLTWDPTPGTWMYAWDSDLREDASLAGSLAYTYRHLPTTQDAAIGLLADGRTPFAFPGAPPAHDLWEVRGRVVGRPMTDVRLIANLFGGTAQANGSDPRLVKRYGGDMRLVRRPLMFIGGARFNDWGPYDYHRDFNLTFPQQYLADVSTVFGTPVWFDVPATRLGVRGTWRSLDKYSPRYCPVLVPDNQGVATCDPTYPAPRGEEWEIRTYLTVAW